EVGTPGLVRAWGLGSWEKRPPAPAARSTAQSVFEHGFSTLFLLAAGLAVVSFVLTLFLKELPLRSAADAAKAGAEVA
ncbi:hypothetical protein GAY28_11380, partial [Azospirillum brasilense]|nr:hypothetical protein [Azospirillum brasilense]